MRFSEAEAEAEAIDRMVDKGELERLTQAEAELLEEMPRAERRVTLVQERRRVKNNQRNKCCPCGSGKKYKKCCIAKEADYGEG